MKKSIIISFIVFLLCGANSWAEPVVTVQTTYYDIQGRTGEELLNEMRHKSHHSDGFAYTDWQIKWNYDRLNSPQGVVVANPKVTMDITYTFPRWTDQEGAPGNLRSKWGKFMKALEIHENGHGKIAMEAVHAVEQAVKSVKPASNAHILGGYVGQAAQTALSQYRRKEIKYDGDTQHGKKQGAYFKA